MVNILNKIDEEGMYLNIIEAVYDKPRANIQWQNVGSFSLKIRNKKRMSTLISLTEHRTANPRLSNQGEKN